MSPAHDLALWLAAQGFGVWKGTTGWAIAVGTQPETPPTAITLYDTGGSGADTGEMDLFRPEVQVRVRSKTYEDGYAKQREIRKRLLSAPAMTLAGGRIAAITTTSSIIPLGKDDNEREVFTCNYRLLRTET